MSRKRFLCIIGILILIEQGIKLFIIQFLMDKNFNILGEYVQFKPYLNVKYSWINSLFDLGVGRILHIIVVMLTIALFCIVYRFLMTKLKSNRVMDWLFILVFSASICSLIDKVFWGGSLDYIALKGLFIFDLKDLYLTIFEVAFVAMIVFNYKNIRSINEKELYREFKQFIALKRPEFRDRND